MPTLGNETLLSRELPKRIINIIIAGCSCHIFHKASSKASDTINNTTGFDISDHCVDLYYCFDKSIKHKCALKEYYDFCDLECAYNKVYINSLVMAGPLWKSGTKRIFWIKMLLSVRRLYRQRI